MLSAHAPLQHYPDIVKTEARRLGATAQVAGGVPAMCDGVTQGTPGMELSLFSRDVIAMATAVSLSHDVYTAEGIHGIGFAVEPRAVAIHKGIIVFELHIAQQPAHLACLPLIVLQLVGMQEFYFAGCIVLRNN